jgi:hypothetical protein
VRPREITLSPIYAPYLIRFLFTGSGVAKRELDRTLALLPRGSGWKLWTPLALRRGCDTIQTTLTQGLSAGVRHRDFKRHIQRRPLRLRGSPSNRGAVLFRHGPFATAATACSQTVNFMLQYKPVVPLHLCPPSKLDFYSVYLISRSRSFQVFLLPSRPSPCAFQFFAFNQYLIAALIAARSADNSTHSRPNTNT